MTVLAVAEQLSTHLDFVPSVLSRLASLLLEIELSELFLACLIDVINGFFCLSDSVVVCLIEIATRLVQLLISSEGHRGRSVAQLLFTIDHVFLPDFTVQSSCFHQLLMIVRQTAD